MRLEDLDNGRTLRAGDELRDRLLANIVGHKKRGERYPYRVVDDLYSVPFVWFGRVPYHVQTLERLQLTREAKRCPVTLPDLFILDGEKRLPGESKSQYHKYLVYRDLGPERSLTKLGRMLGLQVGHLSVMASRWRWMERVAVHDAQEEREAERALAKLREEQLRDHLQRREAYLENEYQIIENTITRIKQMLAFPVDEREVVTERYEDGREKTVTIIHPVRWNLASLSSYIGELQKLARLHFGLSTANTAAKIETVDRRATHDDRELPEAERAAHAYAAKRAEDAYFEALEEYARDHSDRFRLA